MLVFTYEEHSQTASTFKSQSIISPWDLLQKSVREEASDDQNYLRKIWHKTGAECNIWLLIHLRLKKREYIYTKWHQIYPRIYKNPNSWNWNNLIFIKNKNLQLIWNPSNMTQSIIYILKDFSQENGIDLFCPIFVIITAKNHGL